MRRIALTILLGLGGVGLARGEMLGRPPVRVCRDRSDAVFSGTVLAVRDSFQRASEDECVALRVVWIHVEKSWKGVRADTTVAVHTDEGDESASGVPVGCKTTVVTSERGRCGFQVGSRYVVFARGPSLATSCECTAGVIAPWGLIDSLGTPLSEAKVTERTQSP